MLYAPRQTAAAASKCAPWLPLALLSAGGIVADYPALIQLGTRRLVQLRLEASPNGMFPSSVLFFLILTIGAPVLLPLCSLVMGRLVNFYLHYIEDARLKLPQVLRVTAFGFTPVAIERLLAGAMKLLLAGRCDPLNPVATNAAFFLAAHSTSIFWYEAARGADVFSLWAILLISIGLASIADRKPGQILAPVAVIWILGVLARAWLLS